MIKCKQIKNQPGGLDQAGLRFLTKVLAISIAGAVSNTLGRN